MERNRITLLFFINIVKVSIAVRQFYNALVSLTVITFNHWTFGKNAPFTSTKKWVPINPSWGSLVLPVTNRTRVMKFAYPICKLHIPPLHTSDNPKFVAVRTVNCLAFSSVQCQQDVVHTSFAIDSHLQDQNVLLIKVWTFWKNVQFLEG
jgi:hypothetical protein